jgi:hypothetical protein
MAKRKVKEFKPGDKVIWFSTYKSISGREPVIAWVSQEKWYPCVMGSRVRVTRHEKDAQAGLGVLDSQDYVWPWSDEFWAYCEAWMFRKETLGIDLKKLQKGKYASPR